MIQAHEGLEDYEKSLQYSKNIIAIKDSVYNVAKINTEAETADKILLNITIGDNNAKDKQIEDLKASGSRSAITAILTSAFLTIISLLAISLYIYYKQKIPN